MNCREQSSPSPVLELFVLLEPNKGIIKHPKLWSMSLINCYLIIYDIFICRTVVEKRYHIPSCAVVLNISTLWCLWLHHSSADAQYSNTILNVILIKHTSSLPEAFSKEIANPPLFSCCCLCPFLLCAGTERHELTSWKSFDSIFRFFGEALESKEGEEAEETSNTVTTRSGSLKTKHQEL